MRMCSIASGSSGNCIYIGSDNTHLLVDTGISKKRIEAGLTHLDITGDDLDGILITHEHIDHIQGLGVFSRKYEVPVYATSGTIQGIKCAKSLGKLPEGLLHEVKADETFRLGDLSIHFIFPTTPMNLPDTGLSMGRKQRLWQLILVPMMNILLKI